MNFRRMVWTTVILVFSSASVLAQGGGNQGGSTGGSIGTPSTQGGQTIGSNTTTSSGFPTTTTSNSTTPTGTSSTSSSGSNSLNIPGSSSNIAGNQQAQTFSLATLNQAPSQTQTNNTAIATSNFLRNYYGSVYYQGSDPKQTPNRIPGSFGTAIYPATGTGGTGGARGTQGATVGRAGSGGTLTDPGGQIVTLPRQIAYTSQIQFKNPAGNAMPQLQTDLRTAISRIPADMLANPAGVQVSVDGRNVTLKGNVKDDEESRLVEGLVRLTPGVFSIKNELTIAK
ncbi:MAG: BON domain-containing protein [Gemmataceae bacterium]